MDAGGLRVLVVDDDPAPRKILTTLAERSGCQWVEAHDGHEGLAKVLEFRPDIVITDWMMPVMDGVELVRAIRAGLDSPRPYIMLATALEEEDRLVEAFDAGVDEFIAKPLRSKMVAARMRAGQRIVRLQRENQRHIEELQRFSAKLALSNERLRELAVTDELTGLPNRRYAMERIEQEWSASERRQSPLSCMVIDLDGFKQINDYCGHEQGDEVLKTVAATIRQTVRTQDVVCRIGGDEFLVICPDAALDSAIACGERLVGMVGELGIQAAGCRVGLSIGVAERRPAIGDAGELIGLADKAMYRAKQGGKNRVHSNQWN